MKCYLFDWLNGLLRIENIGAIWGSLKRRIFRLGFLEMRADINNVLPSPVWGDIEITGYSEYLERQCIDLLNSVGSLGLWRPSRFHKDILASVENPDRDIFIICDANYAIGFAVLHKRLPNCDLPEVGYVAVRPKNRGKKLGYKLLMYILAEMKKRNMSQAYLRTDSFRLPAIRTYLKAGFYPYMKGEVDRRRWQKALNKLMVNLNNSGEVRRPA